MTVINYPVANKTLVEERLDLLSNESALPHNVKDVTNGKIYKMGIQIKDGKTQLMYEEVV